MTKFSHHNAAGASVHDVERKETIRHVLEIDTSSGEVTCARQPLAVTHEGEIDTFKLKFRSIYPICGLDPKPSMFHCYGRFPESA